LAPPRPSSAKRAKPKPRAVGKWATPVAIGPTWQRDAGGGWLLPERTLGWEVLAWTAEYLRQPDGPNAGQSWRYTDEQARFILWWFAVDAHGRFVYRYGMLRRVKGWGKDPVGATLCAVEFVGPCRFAGWDADGDAVVAPHPAAWVLTAAVAKDQTRNTMTLFPGLFTDAAVNEYGIDLGKEIIYAHQGRCRLEAVTSSPRALEGPRSTFTLKNETQHWLKNNEGHDMAEVIARNSTKSRDGSARVLAISNAHEPGEDSDAEHDYEAWLAVKSGKSSGAGFLYDSIEAQPGVDLANDLQLRAGLRAAKGDSVWLDEDRHVEEILDPRNSRSLSRRFYLNQIVAPEDVWISEEEWDAVAKPRQVAPKTRIVIGVDGARFEDALGIVATDVTSGYQWPLGVWEKPEHADDEYEHPMDEVDGVMVDAFDRYDVWRVYIDPGSQLGNITPLLEKWQGRWGQKRVLPWYMNRLRQTAIACANYAAAVRTAALTHDGNPTMASHVKNAVRKKLQMYDDDSKPLYVIYKDRPGSPRKIDLGAAGVLSWEAFGDCVAAGKARNKPAPRTYTF
jgi:hypothetical protein